jgi:CubicO group peptidase (beta-lactamase class C family)
MLMLFSTADVAAYAAAKELEATPGSRWQYASGTSNIIARIIRTVLQDDSTYYGGHETPSAAA